MNLLGIDFEEWYHPELIKPFVNNEKKELKITKGIDKIPNEIESIILRSA